MRFLISVPDKLKATLKSIAVVRGQTLNGLIREILWDWVQKNEKSG